MPRVLHIEVEEGTTMEEAADLLATRASNFLHELFPARQWRQAMVLSQIFLVDERSPRAQIILFCQ
jgi:hypothetical protein